MKRLMKMVPILDLSIPPNRSGEMNNIWVMRAKPRFHATMVPWTALSDRLPSAGMEALPKAASQRRTDVLYRWDSGRLNSPIHQRCVWSRTSALAHISRYLTLSNNLSQGSWGAKRFCDALVNIIEEIVT